MLISQTPDFQIWRFFAHNSLRNYTYVVVESATRQAAVIDPWEAAPLLSWAKAQQVKLSWLLNTHGHHDHTRGNAPLQEQGVALSSHVPFMRTHATPGHTLDHVSFELATGSERHFFPGDTLFQSGVGNCKNGGDPTVLYHTVRQLWPLLTDETFLHPGHDYLTKNLAFALWLEPANVAVLARQAELSGKPSHEEPAPRWGEERKLNPFLRLSETGLRQRLQELAPDLKGVTLNDEMVFRELRKLRDNF